MNTLAAFFETWNIALLALGAVLIVVYVIVKKSNKR